MILSQQLLARVCSVVVALTIVYVVPLVVASSPQPEQNTNSNNKNMIVINEYTLDIVTINFLNAIEDANVLYDAKNFSIHEELMVRIRLRDAFEEYFATLIPLETKHGVEVTDRSREVIQSTIDEFMELEQEQNRNTSIAQDLDNYSKVMTESFIHTAATV